MPSLKRSILKSDQRDTTVKQLQSCLYDLIDLALQGKEAHWNVLGPNFRSVHLQLDEIIDSARNASDEVAERIVTLGLSPDGRASQIASKSRLEPMPDGLQDVPTTVTLYSDRLAKTISGLRDAIENTADSDPVSQDVLIGVAAVLEKHLWMMQAQEA